jgi:hypothetical protein
MGQAEHYRKNITARTGKPGQNKQDRTSGKNWQERKA